MSSLIIENKCNISLYTVYLAHNICTIDILQRITETERVRIKLGKEKYRKKAGKTEMIRKKK